MPTVHFNRRVVGVLIAASLCLPSSVQAAQLPAPSGEVVLRIDGAITNTNSDGVAEFDLESLEAMPATTIETSTPWTVGVTTFEGVLLTDLLALVGSTGRTVTTAAINDYSVTFPVEDENGLQPIVAYRMNGSRMSVRDTGPLWIVYPYSQSAKGQSETYYTRSIWQLIHITVVP